MFQHEMLLYIARLVSGATLWPAAMSLKSLVGYNLE